MKIIISPAKKMNIDTDLLNYQQLPKMLDKTQQICGELKNYSLSELKLLWQCNDKIALENYQRLQVMDIEKNLTPAILAYDGIQYKHIAPIIFEESMFDYINAHLRILSGFYGMLRPMDGVTPYRLEMQAALKINHNKNLYDFWGKDLYEELEDSVILNLASKEYGKCIQSYLKATDAYVTCIFGELINDKVVQKATFAKMARGEMVRYMAENKIITLSAIKSFNCLGFEYDEKRSTETEFVFLRNI